PLNGSPPSPSISSTSPHCSSVSRGTGTNGPTGNNRIRAGLIPPPSASHGAAQHAAPQSAPLPSSADHADASQPQSPEFSLQPHFSLQEFPLQPEFPLQAARTDEPAQPNPSSFDAARTAPPFLNSPKKIRPLCCAQGATGPEQHFYCHSPSGCRPTRAAATNCRKKGFLFASRLQRYQALNRYLRPPSPFSPSRYRSGFQPYAATLRPTPRPRYPPLPTPTN